MVGTDAHSKERIDDLVEVENKALGLFLKVKRSESSMSVDKLATKVNEILQEEDPDKWLYSPNSLRSIETGDFKPHDVLKNALFRVLGISEGEYENFRVQYSKRGEALKEELIEQGIIRGRGKPKKPPKPKQKKQTTPAFNKNEIELIRLAYETCDCNARETQILLEEDGFEIGYYRLLTFVSENCQDINKMPKAPPKPRKTGRQRIPERDEHLSDGLSAKEITKLEDVTRQALHMYTAETNQKKSWAIARQSRKLLQEQISSQLTSVHKKLLSQIIAVAYKKATHNVGDIHALNWHFNSKSNYPFDNVRSLFRAYQSATEQDKTYSLSKLARIAGIKYPIAVKYILESEGLPPLNPRAELSEEQKEAIHQAYGLDYLTSMDVAFFVRCSQSTVVNYFNKFDEGYKSKRSARTPVKRFPQEGALTYRDTSMIYESIDAGFTIDDITNDIVNVSRNLVNFALENRPELEQKLVSALQVIFPKREITKPYLE